MRVGRGLLILILIAASWLSTTLVREASAEWLDPQSGLSLIGKVVDQQDQPVLDAQVLLEQGDTVIVEGVTQGDGSFNLLLPEAPETDLK